MSEYSEYRVASAQNSIHPSVIGRILERVIHTRLIQGAAGVVSRLLITLTLFAALVWIVRANLGAWTALSAFTISLALMVRTGFDRRRIVLSVLAITVSVSALDYLGWRFTVLNWSAWWISIPLFAAEAFGILHVLGFQFTVWPRSEPAINIVDNPTRHPIFIFIPTVNEGRAILRLTLRGALRAKATYLAAYPQGRVEIVVCNDGRVANAPDWQDTERLAAQMGVTCITRTVKGGAKAGNIENARQLIGATGDAFVVIFDADQVARPEFLLKMIRPFTDPRVGWVQSGQYYRNLDNPVARWAHDQQALFYQVLCPGKARQNAAFICGTNVMIRAAALDEIGGLPQDSVTEDFSASIELHARWRSFFVADRLATGLGPMTLKSYLKQQGRWATGTLSVLRAHWRRIFLPSRNGLSMDQRVQYALACTHYLSGLRDLVYIVAPLVFLFTGISAVHGATLSLFFWHFLPYWLTSQIAFWYVAWRKTSIRGIIIGFGSFPVLIGSMMTAFAGKRVGFAITSKKRGSESVWRVLLPHIIAFLGCVAGLVLVVSTHRQQGTALVSAFWVLYTMSLLTGVFWLGAAQILSRASESDVEDTGKPARVSPPARIRVALRPLPVAIGTLMLAGALIFGSHQVAATPTRFVPAQEQTRPYFGISLPFDWLQSRPVELEHDLRLSFAIVGRNQTISDHFDRVWADQLASHGARPWITLLFAVPGASPIDASLPAIANGVHDDQLRAWAQAIRDYGKPVYLSVLQHVDRNWVLSSAVTNGGIPQDVPRAWNHVQEIFQEEQAYNVAWVWSPADPIHDEAYAPPVSTINVVLLSLISYPNTLWADPGQMLHDLTVHYPNMPLILEVSADGPATPKAAWLYQVGKAVASSPQVYALVYHEGSPAPDAKQADHLPWSMDSDPVVLEAMHEAALVARLQTSTEQ